MLCPFIPDFGPLATSELLKPAYSICNLSFYVRPSAHIFERVSMQFYTCGGGGEWTLSANQNFVYIRMKITDTLSGYLHIPVKRKYLSIFGDESTSNKRIWKVNIDYTLYPVYFSVNLRFFWGNYSEENESIRLVTSKLHCLTFLF